MKVTFVGANPRNDRKVSNIYDAIYHINPTKKTPLL